MDADNYLPHTAGCESECLLLLMTVGYIMLSSAAGTSGPELQHTESADGSLVMRLSFLNFTAD